MTVYSGDVTFFVVGAAFADKIFCIVFQVRVVCIDFKKIGQGLLKEGVDFIVVGEPVILSGIVHGEGMVD